MEMYSVTGYKGTKEGWRTSDPVIEPTEVEALDSYDAATRVVRKFFGKPVTLHSKQRPPDATGVFFEITRPKIVIHVEDLNILKPYRKTGA